MIEIVNRSKTTTETDYDILFEAVQKLKETSVSLIVLDLKMPRMDGMSLLSHTREKYPDIPVIIVILYASLRTKIWDTVALQSQCAMRLAGCSAGNKICAWILFCKKQKRYFCMWLNSDWIRYNWYCVYFNGNSTSKS